VQSLLDIFEHQAPKLIFEFFVAVLHFDGQDYVYHKHAYHSLKIQSPYELSMKNIHSFHDLYLQVLIP
jgi:hypothetical protein